MDINKKLEEHRAYINANSDIQIDVNVEYADQLGMKIINSETPSKEFDLFTQKKNSDLALAILDA